MPRRATFPEPSSGRPRRLTWYRRATRYCGRTLAPAWNYTGRGGLITGRSPQLGGDSRPASSVTAVDRPEPYATLAGTGHGEGEPKPVDAARRVLALG